MKTSSVEEKDNEIWVLVRFVVLYEDVLSSVTELTNLAQILVDDSSCFVDNSSQSVINACQNTALLVRACQFLTVKLL